MVKDKYRNISNRKQYHLATSEPSSPTTENPEYSNTPEKQCSDLKKPHLKKMIEDFNKEISNSLKEIQENRGKQVEAIKEETTPFKKYRKTQ